MQKYDRFAAILDNNVLSLGRTRQEALRRSQQYSHSPHVRVVVCSPEAWKYIRPRLGEPLYCVSYDPCPLLQNWLELRECESDDFDGGPSVQFLELVPYTINFKCAKKGW